MPFTIAHPIAAAPIWLLSKRKLDLLAIAIGTMIPDLQYFIALKPVRSIGHSFQGVFVEGIPCSLVLLLVFHLVFKHPLVALAPSQVADRLPPIKRFSFFPLSRFLIIIASIAIGGISHIVWDDFTHSTGWFVVNFPLLQSKIVSLPLYKLLQYGSGIFGLCGLSIWFLVWLLNTQPRQRQETLPISWKLLATGCILLTSGIFAAIAIKLHLAEDGSFSGIVVRAVIGSISGLFIGVFLYSATFWKLKGFQKLNYSNPK
ncbi:MULTISPECIES: DUF4184 family protein [unclassified Microcoleus]|uniref:DUF4184 family protein n=1 Tax=unclassified Microcoleus TaxID=2642155 RepID=UPI0025D32D0B|nr:MULTISPECIES: DUF4184 family protein [unclassified Microcoleus]